MKQTERASIMRVIADLIEADGIIDIREITFFDELRNKYGIKKEDEIMSFSYTLAEALNILSSSDASLKRVLLDDFTSIAMSDEIFAKDEALLILAIKKCLELNADMHANVISISAENLNFEGSQIIYVESEYDKHVNEQINLHYREICTEIRLAGFDFVYLPKIASHYKSIPESDLLNITSFLYPKVSEERLSLIIRQMQELSTHIFCKEQLSAKLNIREMASVAPSWMAKIGESIVDDKVMTNFLLIEIEEDVVGSIQSILEIFAESYKNYHLCYLKEEKGRFIYKGFYKQIFDIFMLRKGVKSSVVIDTFNERIYFPEADVAIEKIHRREKALYALLLLESASGGINFSKPMSPKQLERYNKRMKAIQTKYKMIYRMFGGEESSAPNIEISEIRLPMIRLLKKQILKLGDLLYHVSDYVIQRNFYGNYSVGISSNLCYCSDGANKKIVLLSESEKWKRISAL